MNKLLNDLTSRDAVLAAIEECERLGREAFLEKYGYKPARKYLLRHNGRSYDSKAIVGVAYGKEHGEPLTWLQFSGGENTVSKCLTRLGFQVVKADHPLEVLRRGTTYYRKDLVEAYGGQLRAGIWTPREFDAVFLFSGESGSTYGYKDGWTDGVYRYTGEGQIGPMKFRAGNKAIRDHRAEGKDLLLFIDLGKNKGVRFEGAFECASWDYQDAKDRNGNKRRAIVFNLVPVNTLSEGDDTADDDANDSSRLPLDELRKAAYEAAAHSVTQEPIGDAKRNWYRRSEQVKKYVLARADGVCEACDEQAPFKRKDGSAYLEPHHTKRLADEGPDHPAWVGAICPNCHRRIHSGSDGEAWNLMLQRRLQAKEPELS